MTDPESPKYATGGIIRSDGLRPLLDLSGCVIPNRRYPNAKSTGSGGDRRASYGNHTSCGLCRKHSINCWCALWPADIAGDRSDLCHEPDAHARLVRPGRILAVPRALSEAEYERIARRWRRALKEDGNALRTINPDGSKGEWWGGRPPWWKRAYYRARRWLA